MGNYESREAKSRRIAALSHDLQKVEADCKRAEEEARTQAAAALQTRQTLDNYMKMMEKQMDTETLLRRETMQRMRAESMLVGRDADSVAETEAPPPYPAPPPPPPPPPPPTENFFQDMRNEAKRQLGIRYLNYNFGVTGQTGSGKSSLINAVRNLSDGDEGAAPTGETETTATTECYSYGADERLVCFWDMPGAGTTKHSQETYFMDKKLYAFDCLVVVTAGRFVENDLKIAKEAHSYNIPVVFVRNKSDTDIANITRRNKSLTREQAAMQLKQRAKDEIRRQLAAYQLEDKQIFVVSALAFMNPAEAQPIDEDDFIRFGESCAKRVLNADKDEHSYETPTSAARASYHARRPPSMTESEKYDDDWPA